MRGIKTFFRDVGGKTHSIMREVAVFIVPEAVYDWYLRRLDTPKNSDAHAWTPAAETSNVTDSSVSKNHKIIRHNAPEEKPRCPRTK